jgi:hypothetical protein
VTTAMSMKALKELDASHQLLKAVELLLKHGIAKGVSVNPQNGSLSIAGAVFVACGAKHRLMPAAAVDAESAFVPFAFQPLADEIILYLESLAGCDDIHEWNDVRATLQLAVSLLRRAALRLIIFGETMV